MTNDWGSCNASQCGQQGLERQGYWCQLYHMDNDTYEAADFDLCSVDTAPAVYRNCSGPICDFKWTIGEWSEVYIMYLALCYSHIAPDSRQVIHKVHLKVVRLFTKCT
jgi:hypothetical protein